MLAPMPRWWRAAVLARISSENTHHKKVAVHTPLMAECTRDCFARPIARSPRARSRAPGQPYVMWPGTPYEHLMIPVK